MRSESEFLDKDRPQIERPSALFKYCPPERADILENLKVRFTQPAVFNDIFESLPGTDQETDIRQVCRNFACKIAQTFAANPHWKRRERRAFEREEKERFKKWCKEEKSRSRPERLCEEVQLRISAITGTLCLSSKWDNILMWSHYANEHRGFVVEFDGGHSFFEMGFEKVVYSDERPLLGNRSDGLNGPEVFFTKSTDWEYEQEYRKSVSFGEKSTLPNGNTFIEFPSIEAIDPKNWPIHLIDFPPSAIRRVILGYRISDETKSRVMCALKNRLLKHVQTARTKPDRRLFRMQLT